MTLNERAQIEASAVALDSQIDKLKAEIADEYFDDEKLDELIDLAMVLGEVYAKRDFLEKAKAQAVPDKSIVVPRTREVVVAIEKMVEQQVEANGITSIRTKCDCGSLWKGKWNSRIVQSYG